MNTISQNFSVSFSYNVEFTEGLFEPDNILFKNTLTKNLGGPRPKVLFVLDEGMAAKHPHLKKNIQAYANHFRDEFTLVDDFVTIPGGEASKNNPAHVQTILDAIENADIDRHSFVTVIGGGAVIDTTGYAAAIAHRGIRLVRIPTTVLAQNDAAVGVKNGVNAYGKKNFLGTFVPPHAVLNDFNFLKTLDNRDWRSGISEAIKVALIKDENFFEFLEENAKALNNRDIESMKKLIHRCAELHLEHISTAGDPFEMGSSRPLDFGHWAAHKLEQLTNYELRHGEAVAIGISLDTAYSHLKGMISEQSMNRVLNVFKDCGFSLYVPELEHEFENPDKAESVLHGLQEFREHLGGELTIMLLEKIGKGTEVHEVDTDLYKKAIQILETNEKELA
ncbi:3-dehydroquinate synthase [Rhodohalobacter sp. SW132]|uniref:3-dehydroquinate synthase n=1 Tax=Rhodohalobacter sp. SW132 TaxID=2293433 RepID=UPI000E21C3FE|nr:3-dehydroquinate synthase [Rhodohalobacter sp. SW132]REL37580.1 3-dehydroquinate synthase [Rhodohalobacter sp. SW132]